MFRPGFSWLWVESISFDWIVYVKPICAASDSSFACIQSFDGEIKQIASKASCFWHRIIRTKLDAFKAFFKLVFWITLKLFFNGRNEKWTQSALRSFNIRIFGILLWLLILPIFVQLFWLQIFHLFILIYQFKKIVVKTLLFQFLLGLNTFEYFILSFQYFFCLFLFL